MLRVAWFVNYAIAKKCLRCRSVGTKELNGDNWLCGTSGCGFGSVFIAAGMSESKRDGSASERSVDSVSAHR
jgi:hypothetical protein